MIRTTTLIFVALLSLVPARTPGQTGPTGAIVKKVDGPVTLKHNGKRIRLNPKSDIERALSVGDSVFCEKGGKLTLETGGEPLELDENSGWYTIDSPGSEKFRKALDAYGRL